MSESSIIPQRKRFKVESIGGEELELLHEREARFYQQAQEKYLTEYAFTMANDFRTLDRLVALEVQMLRYQWFTMAGMDYDGVDLEPKEEQDLHRRMKELGPQIAEIQSTLGVTKAQREKGSHDSVGAYIQQLQVAAKEHGVNRERQLGKALELTKELFSLVNAFSRSNDEERRKLGFEKADDILKWVEDYMQPEFDAIDAYFREHEARFYRRQL